MLLQRYLNSKQKYLKSCYKGNKPLSLVMILRTHNCSTGISCKMLNIYPCRQYILAYRHESMCLYL